jgi:hypothetical protein
MFDVENLHEIERVFRFAYPPAFWERRDELVGLTESERFRAAFPAARLIDTCDEICAAHEAEPDVPNDLIPFLVVGGLPHTDYYGFQVPRRRSTSGGELPVLVWCLHAYVHGWDKGFGEFLDELRSLCAGPSPD